jgi:hypothetical protein
VNTTNWPEPPAERQARKVRVQKRKAASKSLPEIDTRTPSGKTLPY